MPSRRFWPLVLCVLSGCARIDSPATLPAVCAPPPLAFEEKTDVTGIQHTYRNGEEAKNYSILESLGGGVALFDFDGDGKIDIFLTGGGYYDGPDKRQIKGLPNRLYRNLGDWKFEDVTVKTGLDQPLFYTHGCGVADYDNDGWPDLLVTGWDRLALFHNEADGKGGRRFAEVSRQAGMTDTRWSTSVAWADFNGDGFADVYICHYVNWSFANNPPCHDYRGGRERDICPPKQFEPLAHTLYLNNGNGTFRDASREMGLRPDGKGLGVLAADFNDDGKVDLYVANDTTDNFLYLNRGDGRFEEIGLPSGVARDDNGVPNGSMGVDAADYDGSGRLSLFVTNYQHEAHALYRNRGDLQFIYASRSAGIAALGLTYVGFGTAFLDYDRDGMEDILVTNGHVVRLPPLPAEVLQHPLLLRNQRVPGDKPAQVRFANIGGLAGPYFQKKYLGRGLALADLDNDGRMDVVISHVNAPAAILRGVLENDSHWLRLELQGKPYRDAVGARVFIERGDNMEPLMRQRKGGGSYLSAHDPRILVGLGRHEQPVRVRVRWPSGREQTWDGLAADRHWRLLEGEPTAQEASR